nr:hypothetical protein BaRGS_009532 [Batillaria attramentaria]
MAGALNTKLRLLMLIDDMELISKELFELMSVPKSQQKPDAPDTISLMELLIERDTQLKEVLKLAGTASCQA